MQWRYVHLHPRPAASLLTLLFSLSRITCLPAQMESATPGGVIVDEVKANSVGERAGLKPGDMIRSWSRENERGSIQSPFAWAEVVKEQAPRGPLRLHGQHQLQERIWSLDQHDWGLTVAPALPAGMQQAAAACRGYVTTGRYADGADCWRSMLDQAARSVSTWLAPWLLSQAADCLGKTHQWKHAETTYRQALDSPGEDPEVTAQLLELWGAAAYERGDLESAEQSFGRLLALRQSLVPGSLRAAASLANLANVAHDHGNVSLAEDYDRRALAIRERLAPESLAMASSLNNVGSDADDRGDLARAEEYDRKALSIRQRLAPGSKDMGGSLNNLGNVSLERGDLAAAEKYYREALAIFEVLFPGGLPVAMSFDNLAEVLLYRGNIADCEVLRRRALEIRYKLAPGSLALADSLNNLGELALYQGDVVRAKDYLNQALAIKKKLAPESADIAASLTNFGDVSLRLGDLDAAEQFYRQALSISEKLSPDSLDVALACRNLGEVAIHRHDWDQADDYERQALAIEERLAPGSLSQASSLHDLGRIARGRGNLSVAERFFRQAITIRQRLAPESTESAEALNALGSVLSAQKQLEAASRAFGSALHAIESQAMNLGGGEQTQTRFRSTYLDYYRNYMDSLLRLGQPDRAFHVVERSRARSLLNMLAERDLLFSPDVPADIQRARRLNAKGYDRVQAELSRLVPEKDRGQIKLLHARLRELGDERERLTARIRQVSPRFAALQYPQPLDLDETRKNLDAGTTLLSYNVQPARTLLFVVQPVDSADPGLSVLRLPVKAEELRAEVQEMRDLIAHHRQSDHPRMEALSRRLYDQLVKPAEPLLTNSRRLLVVPDGPLHILPFAALRRNSGEYLVEWKPLHTIVSATVYAEIRKMRHPVWKKRVELAVFADPVLGKNGTPVSTRGDAEFSFASNRGLTFGRLPFSREEAEGIASLYPNRSKVYLGPEATEEHAKALGKDVRYIHFATHGWFDEHFPLNSALVLSMPEGPPGSRENGLLQAWEIFDQVRIDADLVALSACDTGLGHEMGGEGLIGLTRAFQYAGAHSILASLWGVNDLWTERLMEAFYRSLKSGQDKDQALRAAQIDLIHSAAASNPFYWAAFTLVGDWR